VIGLARGHRREAGILLPGIADGARPREGQHSAPTPATGAARRIRATPAPWPNQDKFRRANQDRCRRGAARQSANARAALAALTDAALGVPAEPRLSMAPIWRKRWMEVLRRRAADNTSSLSQLAAAMSPPMTKSAFACQLARACRFAHNIAESANRKQVIAGTSGHVGGSSYHQPPAPATSLSRDGLVGTQVLGLNFTGGRGVSMTTNVIGVTCQAPRYDAVVEAVAAGAVSAGQASAPAGFVPSLPGRCSICAHPTLVGVDTCTTCLADYGLLLREGA
jgi:hypothetical protein